MEPLYRVIAMTGSLLILWLGGKNVMGQGWEDWNIAAFAAYLACFTRLAVKSSHAAHLFNALQKADVSWHRIRDFLTPLSETALPPAKPDRLTVSHVSFTYPAPAMLSFRTAPFPPPPRTS